jgi:biopolymer transport protein ExbB
MFSDIARESLTYLQNGGVIMYPLLVVSVWMWALIFRKLIGFSRMFQKESPFRQCMDDRLDPTHSDFGALWQQTLTRDFFTGHIGDPAFDKVLALSLSDALCTRARKHIGTILVLAAAAPLLGLLGTVTGMISTFDIMAQFGTGNAKAMAAGISEALITTQTGLFIAVPGLFMGNFLRRRAENLSDKMQRFAIRMVGE